MTGTLSLWAIALTGVSGLPGIALSRRSHLGERIAAGLMVAGSLCGLAVAFRVAVLGRAETASLAWNVPGGELAIYVDGIAAMFLAQIFLIAPLGAIYGLGYWPQAEHPTNGRKLRLFFGVLTGAMALLVVARNALLFLMGWEVMALAAFLLITTEHEDEAVRKSGFIYIAATRIGTLCLFGMFAALHHARRSWEFAAPGPNIAPSLGTAIFLLALSGFGLKAGLMPVHVWLPGAHANAPSHVSAIMSGVLIKTGIYGLVRVSSFFEHPPLWWGVVLFGIGAVSGVLGVAFALAQHDLKRLLAYHSVENIGIIAVGLGLALIGRSLGEPTLAFLGLSGALLHVWNHGLFKALLFFSAGSVLHATHTREIDRLGGLGRKMPYTAMAFLVGAIAICGLPPLNGFVSELFLYLGFLRGALLGRAGAWAAGALGAPLLALIGALAVACFVKVFGSVFLGMARSDHVRDAKEAPLSMLAPMLVLAACCAFIGLLPAAVAPVLDHAMAAWAPDIASDLRPLRGLAPLGWLSVAGAALVALIAAGAALFAWVTRPSRVDGKVTWDCGYAAPSGRMQYTASSFAEFLVELFSWALRPRVHPAGHAAIFPAATRFHSEVADVVLDRAVLPASRHVGRLLVWFRWVQHGNAQLYILYVLVTLILAVLLWR
ncbi:oxidoreductase [Pendulispora brunnea]|uniref:Oxidoreductase n=1 Tax=Pendulispora brunnea TaxID=2905690 RepID=A0ABZ2K3F5_9BACT